MGSENDIADGKVRRENVCIYAFPAFPAQAQPAILRVCQGTHATPVVSQWYNALHQSKPLHIYGQINTSQQHVLIHRKTPTSCNPKHLWKRNHKWVYVPDGRNITSALTHCLYFFEGQFITSHHLLPYCFNIIIKVLRISRLKTMVTSKLCDARPSCWQPMYSMNT